MLQITKSPGKLCFIGNPIIYKIEVSDSQVELSIVVNGNKQNLTLTPFKVNKDSNKGLVEIDVSDVIRSLIQEQEFFLDDQTMVRELSGFANLCRLTFSTSEAQQVFEITVFRGGISNRLFEHLDALGKDIFSYRLNNSHQQFLFTTRTHSTHLTLCRDELCPYIFIHPNGRLSFEDNEGNIIDEISDLSGKICTISFHAICLQFAEKFGKYPNSIKVCVNKLLSFDLNILPAPITEESYQIKFRNSLGAYEIVTVLGKAEDIPEFADEEIYQSVSDNLLFEEYRERVARRDVLSLELGYKSKNYLHFIKDLISSEEIYLIDEYGSNRCHILADEVKIARKMATPTSISLKARLINDEKYFSPNFEELAPDPEPEATLPAYDKQPIKYVRMEIDPVYDIDTDVRDYTINSIASDDWDKEIQSDPQPGGKTGATYPTRIIGEYEWTLQNMKLRYLPQGYLKQYALSQTALDKSNINSTVIDFIQTSGVPLSADIKTDQYLSLLKAYNLPQEYDDRIPENLFSSRYIRNCKVVDSKIVDDPDSIAWFLPPKRGAAFTSYVLSRASTTNFLGAYQVWGDGSVQASNNRVASNTDLSISQWIGSMGTGILFVVSTDGTKLDDLPPIKVEPGETPSEWNIPKYNYYQSGWDVASKEDYLQLFGMVGEDLSVDNLIKNLFVSPHDPDLPWVKDWILADKSVDEIGSRLLPCGHKQNVSDGVIMGYGERLAFGMKRQDGDQSEGTPSLYFNMQDSTNSVGKLVYDNVTNVPASIKFWQRNYRFCRRLSDAELGYRLWRDDANDKIQVTSLSQSQPPNTVELEKGLLRGLAVRWMNKDKTEILIPLSQLEAETDKTKNDGEYGWYGFYE